MVHGGTRFRAPTEITSDVKQQIAALATLAPLHNHAALSAIEAMKWTVTPGTTQIAVFDTAFHADLPPDEVLSQRRAEDVDVSTADARVRTLVIGGREEWAIADSAVGLLAGMPA